MAFDITWNKFAPGHSSRQRWSISLAGVFFYLAVSAVLAPAVIAGPDKRPNILLIVADDLGYADLGSYGGDIATPSIDSLASEGVLFTQFHTAPLCAPTRSMLLSGNNNHVAGMANQGVRGIMGQDYPGYEAQLSDRIVPFPGLLRDAGYNTYMIGKWHLGVTAENGPKVAGFERSYSLLNGAGNHWDEVGFYEGGSIIWSDDKFTHWPEGAYSTDHFTDQLLGFIEQGKEDDKPFFAFAAYTSPHWPLTVPEKYLNRYAGHYDKGYDHLREQRFESLKTAGIIPADSKLPPRNKDIAPWDTLDKESQKRESRKMELYSAMVENLDDNVGRLVEYLKENDLYKNTLIVFMSDNGAAGEDFFNSGPFVEFIQARYDNSYEKMGLPGSFVSYGAAWAEAGSAPFSRYKGFTREGGVTAPMIMSGPGVSRSGEINASYLTVMDMAPTFLEVAGATYPVGEEIWPIEGESAANFMAGKSESVHDEKYVTTLSHRGRVLVRQGRWKLVNINGPFDESGLELFDLQADPGETINLAESQPEKFQGMLELWRAERARLGIVVPADL